MRMSSSQFKSSNSTYKVKGRSTSASQCPLDIAVTNTTKFWSLVRTRNWRQTTANCARRRQTKAATTCAPTPHWRAPRQGARRRSVHIVFLSIMRAASLKKKHRNTTFSRTLTSKKKSRWLRHWVKKTSVSPSK